MSVFIAAVDATFGRPAEGVPVTLLHSAGSAWRAEAEARTDEAGHASFPAAMDRGNYRLVLDLADYFAALGLTPFHSSLDLAFRVTHAGHPVHLLLSVTPSSLAIHRLTAPPGVPPRAAGDTRLKDIGRRRTPSRWAHPEP